jgi:hypothetical protein
MVVHCAEEVFSETSVEIVTYFHRCFSQIHLLPPKVAQNTTSHVHFLHYGHVLLNEILLIYPVQENQEIHTQVSQAG